MSRRRRARVWPETPACWSWPLPPLPQKNSTGAIYAWQAGRWARALADEPHRVMDDLENVHGLDDDAE